MDDRLQELIEYRQELQKKEFNDEISRTKLKNRIEKIEDEYNDLVQKAIMKKRALIEEKYERTQEDKMKQINSSVINSSKNSSAATKKSSMIIKMLQEKNMSEEKILKELKKKFPTVDQEKLRQSIRNIITHIKKGRIKKYKNFKFNKKEYRLIIK